MSAQEMFGRFMANSLGLQKWQREVKEFCVERDGPECEKLREMRDADPTCCLSACPKRGKK